MERRGLRRYHRPSAVGAVALTRRQRVSAVRARSGLLLFCHKRMLDRSAPALRTQDGSRENREDGAGLPHLLFEQTAPLGCHHGGSRQHRRVALEVAEILVVYTSVGLLANLFYLELAHLTGCPDTVTPAHVR